MLQRALGDARPFWPLVETPEGLMRCWDIAEAPGVGGVLFGAFDYSAEVGCDMSWEPLLFARSQIAAACAMHQVMSERAWPGRGRSDWVVNLGGADHPVRLSLDGDAVSVELTEAGRRLVLSDIDWRPGQPVFAATLDGARFSVQVRPAAEGFVIRHRAAEARVLVLTPVSALLHKRLPAKQAADTAKLVLSPMPGLVVSLSVVEGQEVKTGEVVAIIEAMKMQNIIRAERDGTVKVVGPKAGDSVAADEVLVEFA